MPYNVRTNKIKTIKTQNQNKQQKIKTDRFKRLLAVSKRAALRFNDAVQCFADTGHGDDARLTVFVERGSLVLGQRDYCARHRLGVALRRSARSALLGHLAAENLELVAPQRELAFDRRLVALAYEFERREFIERFADLCSSK